MMGFFSFLSGDKRTKEQVAEQEKFKAELHDYIVKNYGVPKIHGSANYDVYINMGLRKIATCQLEYTFRDYDFSIIRGAYVSIDDQIVNQTSSGIGRAIVGGMIAGTVGAAVGYATRSVYQKTLINNARLMVLTSDPNMPEINIPLLGRHKKNYSTDADVRKILDDADAFINIINQIVVGG